MTSLGPREQAVGDDEDEVPAARVALGFGGIEEGHRIALIAPGRRGARDDQDMPVEAPETAHENALHAGGGHRNGVVEPAARQGMDQPAELDPRAVPLLFTSIFAYVCGVAGCHRSSLLTGKGTRLAQRRSFRRTEVRGV